MDVWRQTSKDPDDQGLNQGRAQASHQQRGSHKTVSVLACDRRLRDYDLALRIVDHCSS